MNRHSISYRYLKRWTLFLVAGLLAFGLSEESAYAKRQRIVLPDGVEVVFDITEQQTTITLTGTSKNSYQIESSEDLGRWIVLRNRVLLDNGGSFTYVDDRALPKCFYRIMVNLNPSSN